MDLFNIMNKIPRCVHSTKQLGIMLYGDTLPETTQPEDATHDAMLSGTDKWGHFQ